MESKSTQVLSKPQGFLMAIVGKPGSGKTTVIKRLLEYELKGSFSYVLLCSPSSIEYECLIPDSQRTSKFSIEWINKSINIINLTKKSEKVSTLLIIDDFISDIKEKANLPNMVSLFFNRRHLLWNGTLSIIITSQKYTMIPARFRSCFTDIIMFNLSPFDVDKVFEESIIKFTKSEWKEEVSKVFEHDYSYVYLNVDKQVILITSQS